jgi:hypothetical protein
MRTQYLKLGVIRSTARHGNWAIAWFYSRLNSTLFLKNCLVRCGRLVSLMKISCNYSIIWINVTVHILLYCLLFKNNQQMHWFLAVYYFYSAAPICFDTYVSSSGSCSVPAELHANRIQWLIRLRHTLLCLLCGGLMCTDLSGYIAKCVRMMVLSKLGFRDKIFINSPPVWNFMEIHPVGAAMVHVSNGGR